LAFGSDLGIDFGISGSARRVAYWLLMLAAALFQFAESRGTGKALA
jgi:hypothetical protein